MIRADLGQDRETCRCLWAHAEGRSRLLTLDGRNGRRRSDLCRRALLLRCAHPLSLD